MCLIVSKVKFEYILMIIYDKSKHKMQFFYLLSDFAYYFLSILFKKIFLENYNALV